MVTVVVTAMPDTREAEDLWLNQQNMLIQPETDAFSAPNSCEYLQSRLQATIGPKIFEKNGVTVDRECGQSDSNTTNKFIWTRLPKQCPVGSDWQLE